MSRKASDGDISRRAFLKAGAAAGGAAALSGGLVTQPAGAARLPRGHSAPVGQRALPGTGASYEGDLVLYNGRIHTMNEVNDVVSVVAIQRGTIVYAGDSLGSAARLFRGYPDPQRIDLRGHMACPGIIDATNHISLLGNRPGHHTPLEYAQSINDVLAIYRARARRLPASPNPPAIASDFITTMGDFSPTQLREQRLPTLSELDSAVPNNAAYITVGFTGPSVTNSLGKAFFEAAAPYPVTVGSDGSIAEGEQTGRATFALRQTLTFDQRTRGFRDAFAFLASIGLTTNIETGAFQTTGDPSVDNVASEDNYTYNQPALAVYDAGQGLVRMRIDFLCQDTTVDLPVLTQRLLNNFKFMGNDMVRTGGIGEWISDVPDGVPAYTAPTPVFTAACLLCAESRWRAQCQGLIPSAVEAEIVAFEAANAQYPITDLRWVIGHSILTQSQIGRMNALGAGMTCSGYQYLAGTGPAAGPPYRLMLDNGVHVGMDSDAADISMFSPWQQMYYATTGLNAAGNQINAGQQITRQEALFHYTNANAWFVGPPEGLGPPDGELLGVIEVGRHGDIVVPNADFFAVPDADLKQMYSALTVVGGRVVHSGPVQYAANA